MVELNGLGLTEDEERGDERNLGEEHSTPQHQTYSTEGK